MKSSISAYKYSVILGVLAITGEIYLYKEFRISRNSAGVTTIGFLGKCFVFPVTRNDPSFDNAISFFPLSNKSYFIVDFFERHVGYARFYGALTYSFYCF